MGRWSREDQEKTAPWGRLSVHSVHKQDSLARGLGAGLGNERQKQCPWTVRSSGKESKCGVSPMKRKCGDRRARVRGACSGEGAARWVRVHTGPTAAEPSVGGTPQTRRKSQMFGA